MSCFQVVRWSYAKGGSKDENLCNALTLKWWICKYDNNLYAALYLCESWVMFIVLLFFITVGGSMLRTLQVMNSRTHMNFSFLCLMAFMKRCRRISASPIDKVTLSATKCTVKCPSDVRSWNDHKSKDAETTNWVLKKVSVQPWPRKYFCVMSVGKKISF